MQDTALCLYLQAELRLLHHVAATATAIFFAFVACLTVAAALRSAYLALAALTIAAASPGAASVAAVALALADGLAATTTVA